MTVRIAGLQLHHRLAIIVKVVRIAATKPTARGQQAGRVVPLVKGVAEIAMARSSGAYEKQSAVRIATLLCSWRLNARMVLRNLVLFGRIMLAMSSTMPKLLYRRSTISP